MEYKKLSEREKNRMVDICAEAPLEYIPFIDDRLMDLGLIIWWNKDEKTEVVHNPKVPFYEEDGKILPKWC